MYLLLIPRLPPPPLSPLWKKIRDPNLEHSVDRKHPELPP